MNTFNTQKDSEYDQWKNVEQRDSSKYNIETWIIGDLILRGTNFK